MNKSDGSLMPYEEVPKDEGSIKMKMKFRILNGGAIQGVEGPMICT